MRLLVLAYFFPPDLSAGSFRMASLVPALATAEPPPGAGPLAIDVLTTLPNRYATFSAAAPEVEERGAVTVRRFPLPPHASGLADQCRSFAAYARAVSRHVRRKRYDLVFATSSKLMTAVLGSRIARRQGVPLYLDIRDIFVDTIGDMFPGWKARIAKPLFSAVERYAFGRAARINLVSEGFRDYFAARYPRVPLSFHTNGIDPEFLEAAAIPTDASASPAARSRLRVVYAGNMGEGQGLHHVIPALARRLADRVEFVLVGDGGRRSALEAALAAASCTNVEIRRPVERKALIATYRDADVLFLHLNDLDAFEKVLPSKIFEYAALGKPIWAGVRGHAADFLTREVENAAVFPPCDVEAAVAALDRLRLAATPRAAFVAKYSREAICRQMAAEILATGQPRPSSLSQRST